MDLWAECQRQGLRRQSDYSDSHAGETRLTPTPAPDQPPLPPSFSQALRFWLTLGFISFGGPAGQIAIMHTELVERRRWISEQRFLHALNYCMVLPGPEAQQLGTYIGWLLHRTAGGIVAGALFVLPSLRPLTHSRRGPPASRCRHPSDVRGRS